MSYETSLNYDPTLKIVIVGHVDHGKSTLVGRLLHETNSLPDGKVETLRQVCERRGMPFEWAFVMDALQAEREQGLKPEEAIYQACLLRFRPILMTTMAALLGALPLMLGTGVGSELRHPLGVTMVGGLIFSQVLTLFTTPVIYLMFDRLSLRFGKNKQKTPDAPAGAGI